MVLVTFHLEDLVMRLCQRPKVFVVIPPAQHIDEVQDVPATEQQQVPMAQHIEETPHVIVARMMHKIEQTATVMENKAKELNKKVELLEGVVNSVEKVQDVPNQQNAAVVVNEVEENLKVLEGTLEGLVTRQRQVAILQDVQTNPK